SLVEEARSVAGSGVTDGDKIGVDEKGRCHTQATPLIVNMPKASTHFDLSIRIRFQAPVNDQLMRNLVGVDCCCSRFQRFCQACCSDFAAPYRIVFLDLCRPPPGGRIGRELCEEELGSKNSVISFSPFDDEA